jgi:hypothetical protein
MKTSLTDRYQPAVSKQHEGKMLELRHERKSESLHLDGLKKALRSKLGDAKLGDAKEDKLQVA